MNDVRHLLLTRFNVRWIVTPADIGWLRHRFALFDRFCFPSVRSQTAQDFRWLLFFDEDTPAEFLERIDEYARWPVFTPVFIGPPSSEAFDEAIRAHVGGAGHVITTRLDNDDAIGRDFVARVQAGFTGQDREFLNLPVGYVWHRGRAYRFEHPSNAFLSLVERADDMRTVWCDQHENAPRLAPVRQLGAEPAWLQVIHDRNVSNRVRGTRHPTARLLDQFSIDAADLVAHESAAGYWLDRTLLRPGRVARDGAFRLAKPVRDSLERATAAARAR